MFNSEQRASVDERAPEWLTEHEAAAHLRYSIQHVRRLRHDGTGPRHYPLPSGRGARYRRDDLDAWLAGRSS